MTWMEPCLRRSRTAAGDLVVSPDVPLLDGYLEFRSVRARPNTVLAAAYDLKIFFGLVGKPPHEVTSADVLGFARPSIPAAGRAGCNR
jgi:integrase/recombinase XerD